MRTAITLAIIFGTVLGIPALMTWFLCYIYEASASVCVHCVHCIDYEEPSGGDWFYECDIKGKMRPHLQCGRFKRITPWRRRHE